MQQENKNQTGKIIAWEKVKKDFPHITKDSLTEWEKQQVVKDTTYGVFRCSKGYCYTIYSDGTYKREPITSEMNLI